MPGHPFPREHGLGDGVEWLTIVAAVGGGTGLGAVLKAVLDARGSAVTATNTQLNALVDQLQEDRREDRDERNNLSVKVETVLELYHIEREHSADLYAWGLAGAPPPPPERRKRATE